MSTWSNIPDDVLEPGKPIRSVDAIALRNNPIAIAIGAAGAPRIASDQAINWGGGGVGNTSATNWVLNRTAPAAVGAVGTYAFLGEVTNTVTTAPGGTRAGSALRYIGLWRSNAWDGAAGEGQITAGDHTNTPTGTWRCMGHSLVPPLGGRFPASLWLRIS